MHLSTCSSPTPSTVLLYNIRDVTRRHTVGSSCPRVKHTIDEYVCTNIPPSHQSVYSLRRPIEYIPCTYPLASSPIPYTVLLNNICDATRRQTVGSSYPRVKQSILLACRRAPVHKERPYHRSTFVYTMFAMLYVDRTSTTGDSRSAIESIRLRQSALYRRLLFPRTGKHFF